MPSKKRQKLADSLVPPQLLAGLQEESAGRGTRGTAETLLMQLKRQEAEMSGEERSMVATFNGKVRQEMTRMTARGSSRQAAVQSILERIQGAGSEGKEGRNATCTERGKQEAGGAGGKATAGGGAGGGGGGSGECEEKSKIMATMLLAAKLHVSVSAARSIRRVHEEVVRLRALGLATLPILSLLCDSLDTRSHESSSSREAQVGGKRLRDASAHAAREGIAAKRPRRIDTMDVT